MSYGKAIKAINPNAEFTIDNDDLDNIVWLNNTTPISKEDIISKENEISYIAKREKEYPNIIDQLDDIYHNGIDGWKETIKAVKDKYPK
tara:strand:+ start:212 stop:478 length:267 start_codon:yes stop_codon:yes gene_type:complete